MTRPSSLILASASPRRRDLLRSAGVAFEVDPSDIDETPAAGENARQFVRRMASEKGAPALARRIAAGDARPVLAADTVVVINGTIIGKPRDRAGARDMLNLLSGRAHKVITGFCLLGGPDPGFRHQEEVTTEVRFKPLLPQEIETYLETGEWQDKAGAYAIQGRAAFMVEAVSGSYTNIVGLPLAQVIQALYAWRQRRG